MSRISDAMKRAGGGEPMPVSGPDLQSDSGGASVLAGPATLELEPVPETVSVRREGLASHSSMDHATPTDLLESASANLDLKLVANPALQPVAIEQYRRLAAILHHTQEARGIRRVLIASALAEEGKTLTAVNLALTLSQSYGRRVLLVDADMRRPGISHLFRLPAAGGLSEALYNPVPQKLNLVKLSDKLSVLPAGHALRDPMAGLSSPTLAAILEEAGETFDWVIIDSPPVAVMSDAKLLAATVDAAILVIAAGRTPYASLHRATEALGRDRIIGVVLNRVDESIAAPGEYYYYHYYGHTPRNGKKPGWLARLIGRK